MKSFFSSHVLKFNSLLYVCALGVTTFSLPVTADAQEICVMTSAGNVVCGKPVPKPRSSPNRAGNNQTIQTEVQGSITWELKSCVREARNVSCTLSLSTSKDIQQYIVVVNQTKLVDSSGYEYYANRIQVGGKAAGASDVQFGFPMAQGADYQTTVNFTDVPTSVSQVTLLQIVTTGYAQVRFRNVRIN